MDEVNFSEHFQENLWGVPGFVKKPSYCSLNTAFDIFSVYLVFVTVKDFYNKREVRNHQPGRASRRLCKHNDMVDRNARVVCADSCVT